MNRLPRFKRAALSSSSRPPKRQKNRKTAPDLITDDDVKNRVLSCFEDVVFITCSYLAFYYSKKYLRRLDTQNIDISKDLPPLLNYKLRVIKFSSTKPNKAFFFLTADPTGHRARALPPDISSQRHSDFKIVRKRLLRLCSDPVDYTTLSNMYLYVYGGEPKFPLELSPPSMRKYYPALRFNEWRELIDVLPLKTIKIMRGQMLTPLWLDEANEKRKLFLIYKREPDSYTPSFPMMPSMPLHSSKPFHCSIDEANAYARFWHSVITWDSDEDCSIPISVMSKPLPALLPAPLPLNQQIVRNSTLQPQTFQYQSGPADHPPLSVIPFSPPWKNQSLTLAQPSEKLVSSLHLNRLRIIKLFEDVVYISEQDLIQHHYLKYGVKLDIKTKPDIWMANFLPLTLCQLHRDMGSTIFALRQSHLPPPTSHPLPVEILRMRVLRLTQCHMEPNSMLQLYERAYGPLHQHQFPVSAAPGAEAVAWNWPEFIEWTRAEGSKGGCRALYATEGEEYKEVPIMLAMGQNMSEGWTVFVGSEGRICAEELLRKGEERPVGPPEYANADMENLGWDEKKVDAEEGMMAMIPRVDTEERMVAMIPKMEVKMETEVKAEMKMETEVNAETTEIVTESLVSQVMRRIPPDMVTPAQRRMLDVMFFLNSRMPKSRCTLSE